jgi:hypothetical protein
MAQCHPAWVAHQRKLSMRPNAELYWRPDAARFMTPEEARLFLPDSMQPRERKDDPAPALPSVSPAQRARDEWVRKQDILRLKWQIAALRFERMLIRHMLALRRQAKFDPNQPRVPAGDPAGGQWISGDGGGGGINDPRVIPDVTPVDEVRPGAQYATLKRPGGRNNPSPDLPPKIPQRRPPNSNELNLVVKLLARSAIAIEILKAGPKWLYDHLAEIQADRDPPKTIEELQHAVTENSKPGYQDHHVVGQYFRGKFPDSRIDAPDNVVRIPTLKHREISSWYSRKNYYEPKFGGRTPRDYLEDKGWDEHYRVGLELLRRYGVLAP